MRFEGLFVVGRERMEGDDGRVEGGICENRRISLHSDTFLEKCIKWIFVQTKPLTEYPFIFGSAAEVFKTLEVTDHASFPSSVCFNRRVLC